MRKCKDKNRLMLEKTILEFLISLRAHALNGWERASTFSQMYGFFKLDVEFEGGDHSTKKKDSQKLYYLQKTLKLDAKTGPAKPGLEIPFSDIYVQEFFFQTFA